MKPTSLRTHCCDELRAAHIGQRVSLAGWVHSRRDHGGVYFLDLRDRSGLVQVVVNPEEAEAFLAAAKLGSEHVIAVSGEVLIMLCFVPAGTSTATPALIACSMPSSTAFPLPSSQRINWSSLCTSSPISSPALRLITTN